MAFGAAASALGFGCATPARGQTPHIRLYVEMDVAPEREEEMLDTFHNVFVPEAVKHDGYIRVKMLRRRTILQGTAPANHNSGSRLDIGPRKQAIRPGCHALEDEGAHSVGLYGVNGPGCRAGSLEESGRPVLFDTGSSSPKLRTTPVTRPPGDTVNSSVCVLPGPAVDTQSSGQDFPTTIRRVFEEEA